MQPTCYSDIIRGANVWLQNNRGLQVWKCETVERKVELGPVVLLDSTVHHESSYGANCYVFGVRCVRCTALPSTSNLFLFLRTSFICVVVACKRNETSVCVCACLYVYVCARAFVCVICVCVCACVCACVCMCLCVCVSMQAS